LHSQEFKAPYPWVILSLKCDILRDLYKKSLGKPIRLPPVVLKIFTEKELAACALAQCTLHNNWQDEVDSLAPQRGSSGSEDFASRRLLTELLLQLNQTAAGPAISATCTHGSNALGGVYVFAATNRIQVCDSHVRAVAL